MFVFHENAVATAELVFYTVAFSVAVALTVRLGWHQQPCWLSVAAFAMLRILGSAMQLGTIAAPLNLHLYRGAATLAHVGLSLLLFASLGFIFMVQKNVHRKRQTIVRPSVIHLQSLLLVVALILCIVGATSVPDSEFAGFTTTKVPATLVVSTIIFIVAYLVITICVATLCFYVRCVPSTERRLLIATAASLPFMLVRVVYSALCMFLDDLEFHWFKGCQLKFIVMDLIMEMLVITVYECSGIMTACRMSRGSVITSATRGKSPVDRRDDHSFYLPILTSRAS